MLDHISHSQIQLFNCPLRYKKIRIDKEYEIGNEALSEGSFVHKCIEDYTLWCLDNNQIDEDVIKEIFKREFVNYKIPDYNFDRLYKSMKIFAHNFNHQYVLDAEKQFDVDLGDDCIMSGRIDRVDLIEYNGRSMIRIVDYKNQVNIVRGDGIITPQMRLYGIVAANFLYPEYDLIQRAIYYTRYNVLVAEDPKPMYELQEDTEDTIEYYKTQRAKIKHCFDTDTFEAVAGEHCYQYGGCPVAKAGKCPLHKESPKGIIEMYRAYHAKKLDVDNLRKQIKTYITENGNVQVDDKEVGYVLTSTEGLSLGALIELINKANVDVDGITIPKTKIIKRLKDAGVEKETIDKLLYFTTKTKLSL